MERRTEAKKRKETTREGTQFVSVSHTRMSVLSSLSKNHLFDSVEDILLFIKKVEVEDSVYLRRDKPIQTVVSYNKDIKNKNKIDEKWLFKRLTYVCPHYGIHRDRSKTKDRLNQNVMPQSCPVKVQFTFCSRQEKFYVASLEVVHQNHPVSAEHVSIFRHMAPEALAFAEATLSAGAQPTKVRKLLQDKFGSHLISKDLINIKQALTGKSDNEWRDTVDYLMDKTTKAGFSLYHLLIEDNNGDGQPVAMFFMKEETVESIATCLQVFFCRTMMFPLQL